MQQQQNCYWLDKMQEWFAWLQIKHARELHKDHQEVLPKDANDRELLKKAGRY